MSAATQDSSATPHGRGALSDSARGSHGLSDAFNSEKPVRVDAWLWAVRVYKTRSGAAEAARAGHVKVNGVTVKPAQRLVPGDRVRTWVHHRVVDVEVVRLIQKRVGASLASQCYVDHSPAPASPEIIASMPRRDRGAGRPTKKDRRQMEKLRGYSR